MNPVDFVPLLYRGKPFVAGINGFDRNNNYAYETFSDLLNFTREALLEVYHIPERYLDKNKRQVLNLRLGQQLPGDAIDMGK